jgi:integrase
MPGEQTTIVVQQYLNALGGDAPAEADRVFAFVPEVRTLKRDLKKAGIEFTDGAGRRVDFHAVRHTHGTLLSKAGVAPRLAMESMRHTDIRLTMNVYTDPRISTPPRP